LIKIASDGEAKAPYLGKLVVTNIFVSVLIRQEDVVNTIFRIFTSVPQSWPLWFRLFTARVYSLVRIFYSALSIPR